jgi:hypothetical protein
VHVVAIRKSRAKPKADLESAVMRIEHGAHIKAQAAKYFGPKFGKSKKDENDPNIEETFWAPKIRVRFVVVDDRTAAGDFDGCEFSDDLPLKLDLDILDATGFDEKRLKNSPPKSNFTKEEQEMLLDESNWTIRDETKTDNYLSVTLGEAWTNGEVKFDEDLIVDTAVIAKILPRKNGKGSYCDWNTFISVYPPKKQKKGGKSKKAEKEGELTAQETHEMEAALGKS